MSGAEWGITADEGHAIIAQARGEVLVRDANTGGRAVHEAKLLAVTNSRGMIRRRGGQGVWYDLGVIKPCAGEARDVVTAMRGTPKKAPTLQTTLETIGTMMNPPEATETKKHTTETTMPPDFAPRPAPKATNTLQPGSLTIAASHIETACKEVEAKRADVVRAEADLKAARDLLDGATEALAKAEQNALKLAQDFNAMVSKLTKA